MSHLPGDGTTDWLSELGVTDAPLTRASLETALRFFRARMPKLPRATCVSFLKAMDLHSPVADVPLVPGESVAAFRQSTEDPLRLFYTKVGVPLQRLGVNPADRAFRRFRVVRPAHALQSRTAPARDTWSDPQRHVLATGGGTQLIIPDATTVLEVTQ